MDVRGRQRVNNYVFLTVNEYISRPLQVILMGISILHLSDIIVNSRNVFRNGELSSCSSYKQAGMKLTIS